MAATNLRWILIATLVVTITASSGTVAQTREEHAIQIVERRCDIGCRSLELRPDSACEAAPVLLRDDATPSDGPIRIRPSPGCVGPCAMGSRLSIERTLPGQEGAREVMTVPACGGPTTILLQDGSVLQIEYLPAPAIRFVDAPFVIRDRVEISATPSASESLTPSPTPS